MNGSKRSILIAILTLSVFLISFIAAFINSNVIVVISGVIIISIGIIIAKLILQSREEEVDTIVQTIINKKRRF